VERKILPFYERLMCSAAVEPPLASWVGFSDRVMELRMEQSLGNSTRYKQSEPSLPHALASTADILTASISVPGPVYPSDAKEGSIYRAGSLVNAPVNALSSNLLYIFYSVHPATCDRGKRYSHSSIS
jgi:hypothetical protein